MPAMDYPEDVARKNQVLMRFFPIMDPDPVTPSSKAGAFALGNIKGPEIQLNSPHFVYYEAVVSRVRRDTKQGTKLRTRPPRPWSNDLGVTGAAAPFVLIARLEQVPSGAEDTGTAVGRGLAGFSCGPRTVHISDLRQKTWGLGGLGGQRRRI
ncbi:hypothetical protein CSOJ01_06041 [Colletotrichum sojae]|uniref:Uncharacterized protein n=1 Tax=Colletotrichum sojae TaxID=2175907 RepID=A0A8H6JD72_9PEZI|nr:hypothetical protein CSOJ01_06041 [Colletotrichum sojae]